MHISNRNSLRWALSLLAGLVIWGVSKSFWIPRSAQAGAPLAADRFESNEPIQPIEPLSNLNQAKVALGRKLFDEPRLSHNNELSCASCHVLKAGGADGRARSIGINGAIG